jgi:hypothetical protein
MKLVAKLICNQVTKTAYNETAELSAVYSNDPSTENYSFTKATPVADLKLVIDNPSAIGYFQPGAEYRLEFVRPRETADKTAPSAG